MAPGMMDREMMKELAAVMATAGAAMLAAGLDPVEVIALLLSALVLMILEQLFELGRQS